MPLESATFVSQLVPGNPTGVDAYSSADDHFRLIKQVLRDTFPNLNAAVNATPTELNHLVGVTSALQTQLNVRELSANKNVANGYAGLDAGALLLAGRFPALIGNVTTPGGSLATTIANDVVTNAMLANFAADTQVLGRAVGVGAGDPQYLTAAQLVAIITTADGSGSLLDADTLDGNSAGAFATASHTHGAADVSSGTLATARLGSGTADAAAYLRGDSSWQALNFAALAGTIANAQVPVGAVTQHQAALALNNSQSVGDVNSQTASFSVASSMAGDFVVCDSASTIIVTVGNNAFGAAGLAAIFIRRGAGAVTFTASGVTIRSKASLLSISLQHAKVGLIQIDATNFELTGDLG